MPYLCGQLKNWPSRDEMAGLFSSAGFRVSIGDYSVRLLDYEHFVFQEYGGDLGHPVIDVEAETIEQLITDASRVSEVFARANIAHRLEIYNDDDALVKYLHFDWPQVSEPGA